MSAKWLTVRDYAAAMNLSEESVRRRIRQQRIPAKNIGTERRHDYRIPASELAA